MRECDEFTASGYGFTAAPPALHPTAEAADSIAAAAVARKRGERRKRVVIFPQCIHRQIAAIRDALVNDIVVRIFVPQLSAAGPASRTNRPPGGRVTALITAVTQPRSRPFSMSSVVS